MACPLDPAGPAADPGAENPLPSTGGLRRSAPAIPDGASAPIRDLGLTYAIHQRSTALKPSRLQLAPISSWASFLERPIT